MDIIKYQAFIEVIKEKSITKAAQNLGYSQPNISYMIKSFEKEMGFPLIIKTKNGIYPSEAGSKILYYCQQIVKNQKDMISISESVKGLMTGTLQIEAINSMLVNLVPDILQNFTDFHPNILITLHERSYGEIMEDLEKDYADIAFTSRPGTNKFEFVPLFNDPVYLVVNKIHPFAKYTKIAASDINKCDFIMPVPGFDDTVKAISNNCNISPTVKYYTASDKASVSLVAKNLGVYVISRIQAVNLPDSVVVKKFKEDFTRTLGMAFEPSKSARPVLKHFIDTSVRITEQLLKSNKMLTL